MTLEYVVKLIIIVAAFSDKWPKGPRRWTWGFWFMEDPTSSGNTQVPVNTWSVQLVVCIQKVNMICIMQIEYDRCKIRYIHYLNTIYPVSTLIAFVPYCYAYHVCLPFVDLTWRAYLPRTYNPIIEFMSHFRFWAHTTLLMSIPVCHAPFLVSCNTVVMCHCITYMFTDVYRL
jgi:hypothetical protein